MTDKNMDVEEFHNSINVSGNVMDSDNVKDRKFYRLKDKAIVRWGAIDNSEKELILQQDDTAKDVSIKLMNLEMEFRPLLDKRKVKDKELYKALSLLNDKINIIFKNSSIAESTLINHIPTEIDISAGGISFNVAKNVVINTAVKLELVFLPNYEYVKLVGDVVGCEPNQQKDIYNLRVQFSTITDEKRDLIVRHIMQKESAMLRKRRLDGIEEQ